jgi:hypothetical protein
MSNPTIRAIIKALAWGRPFSLLKNNAVKYGKQYNTTIIKALNIRRFIGRIGSTQVKAAF